MIQGCRYLRRSMDRWILSKNSTTRQRIQRFGVKPVCYENVFEYNYIHPGSIFIPCHGMTPNGLRALYLIPNLSLSAIAYPSIRPFRSGHVITQSRKISANSFLAERKQTADREPLRRIFLEKPSFFRTDFFIKLGPQVRLLPVPNFCVSRTDQVISTCSYRTRPRLPAWIGIRCDRTGVPKGGRFRSRTGGHDLKMLLMRFTFLSSSILFGSRT
jgi:hypothetical protein